MPSFGSFLKKKRTKEGHPDKDGHSHSSASNPTSPVAPSAPASKLFDSSTLQQPRATGGSHSNHTGAGSGSTGAGTGAGTTIGTAPAATGLGLGLGLGLAASGTAVSPGSISPSASTPIPASAPASSIPASAPASAQAPAPAASSAERDTAKAAPPVSPTSTSTSTMNPVNVHFGRVHLVQSKHNQRFYAVKVLKKAQVVKMKQVEHTNDERRMLSDVKHPFLITLWGTFQDWKNLYMVMDFVEGGELFSLLRKSGV
ncbi:hypothetical protein TGAM01_v210665 [Trichoderma gamsii]|uniref:cAMP-dependent protein kinase n=1 Tax=Trichoderma gamsii TaxID=398673 RepID=A0A2P4Z883_9HYPO|nr:hypothetical protein TGAM01_v210665 [Trichoderma gamsii]PON20495.1 hypothetical protein TGAM01_v210665 [Trichoderma gamsii]